MELVLQLSMPSIRERGYLNQMFEVWRQGVHRLSSTAVGRAVIMSNNTRQRVGLWQHSFFSQPCPVKSERFNVKGFCTNGDIDAQSGLRNVRAVCLLRVFCVLWLIVVSVFCRHVCVCVFVRLFGNLIVWVCER